MNLTGKNISPNEMVNSTNFSTIKSVNKLEPKPEIRLIIGTKHFDKDKGFLRNNKTGINNIRYEIDNNNNNFRSSLISNKMNESDISASISTNYKNETFKPRSINLKNKLREMNTLDIEQKKDKVYNFFNRDFYSCEIPISKKIIENQNILDYYINDKELREKFKQLMKRKKLIKKTNNHHIVKSMDYEENNDINNKEGIKKSLMLNDFSMYNRIRKVVRFWGKFINYACPIFQVQKFSLNGKKYRSNSNKYIEENNKNSNNIKLPKLYTNSSGFYRTKLPPKFLRKTQSSSLIVPLKNKNY